MTSDIADPNTLTSKWSGLSPHLQARFYEVDYLIGSDNKKRWKKKDGSAIVSAPLNDSTNLEVVLNWQSQFEQYGPESKAPALASMLKSGVLQPILSSAMPDGSGEIASIFKKALESSIQFLDQYEGRSGITKLNSTQIFNGMPPLKFSVVALFRAWDDPQREVEDPVAQLMSWALPQELASDGMLLKSGIDYARGKVEFQKAVMPSVEPVKLAMEYKRRVFMPLVIESIGVPLNAGVNTDGRYVEMMIPMTLCSLTAIDRADWAKSAI
jgi:hypothetical protein